MNSLSLLKALNIRSSLQPGTRNSCTRFSSTAHLVAVILLFAVTALPSALPAGNPKKANASSPASVDTATLVHLLDSVIVPGLNQYQIPGMVVAIVRDSEIILEKGYGYADLDKKIPFDPAKTVVRIASVSKLITGTAVLQLVDRGILDMERDVNGYLTKFKVEEWPGKPITLQHLLTHTAGFDDRAIGKAAWTQESQIPLGEYLATQLPRRIVPPGEIYTYSNLSNALAGFVVEEAAHQDYADYARQNILEPLGMTRSDYRLRPDLEPLLAQCYSHAGAGLQHNRFDFINDYPGGQMLSTADDMAKFIIAQMQLGEYRGKRILSKESAIAMHTPQFTHHKELEHAAGYSFGILPARSQTILMHDGGWTGTGTRLCIAPESHIGFFMACNIMDGVLLDKASRIILDLVIPESPKDTTVYPLAAVPPHDKDVSEFAGTYRFSRYVHSDITKMGVLMGMTGSEMRIGRNDDGMILMATYSGKPRRMVQVQPCLFQSIDDRYYCAFRRDESGKVTHLFTDGTTSFEKIAWYETAGFQRGLAGVCLLFFAFVSIVLPIVRRIRKKKSPSGLSADPLRWLSQTTASTFLLYVLGLGIVMMLVIPREELMIGFAHGMHWSAYVAQTIALLGILFLAGLLGSIFWRIVERSKG
ncbi:MAG TPA: serine hydrolase domain-containing protein, partial [Bacteroidota bacterium]|nr:serine hydrolase domain-containing protein [Bacteroidota bacterium]